MKKILFALLFLGLCFQASANTIEAHNVNILDNGSTTAITAGFKITTHAQGIYIYNLTAKSGATTKNATRGYIRTAPGITGGVTVRLGNLINAPDNNLTTTFAFPARLTASTDYYLLTYNVTGTHLHELWIASSDGKVPTGFPITGTIADWTGGAANGVANSTTGFNIISYNASAYVPEEYTTDPIWDNGDFASSGKSGWKIHVNGNPIFIAALHVQFCTISGDPTSVYILDSSQNVVKAAAIGTQNLVDFGDCTGEVIFDTPVYLSANTDYYLADDAEGGFYGVAFFSPDGSAASDSQTGAYFNFISGLQDGSASSFAFNILGADVIEVGGATPTAVSVPNASPTPQAKWRSLEKIGFLDDASFNQTAPVIFILLVTDIATGYLIARGGPRREKEPKESKKEG